MVQSLFGIGGGGDPGPVSGIPTRPSLAAQHGRNTVITVPGRPDAAPALARLKDAPAAAAKLADMLAEQADIGEMVRLHAGRRHNLVNERHQAADYHHRLAATPVGSGGRRGAAPPVTYLGGRPHEPAGGITEHYFPDATSRDRRIKQAEAELEALDRQIAEIDRQIAALEAKRSRLPQTATEWLRDVPAGAAIEVCPQPQPPKTANVDGVRQRIAKLRNDRDAVRDAPIPSGVAIEMMRQQVENLAEKGAPSVLPLLERGGSIVFPKMSVRSQLYGSADQFQLVGFSSAEVPDTLALFCFLHRDLLIAKLQAEIIELADDASALDDDQRRRREAELSAEILQCERLEEALIEQAEAEGKIIPGREDADPRALLGVVVVGEDK
jgi:hypothetical protein